MFQGTQLFALWPFASAGLLWWALAAAAPVLIHLWNRRRYRTERWAATRYLLAALKHHARRMRFNQWLLLALRVLLLVLFAVALAEPLFVAQPAGGTGGAAGQVYTILVIDGSYSMDFREGGKSRFELAKELAASLVDQGSLGDGYSLYLLANSPRPIIGEPAFEPRDVLNELDALRLPHGGANLPALFDELLLRCSGVRANYPRLSQTRVLFFTDLGRSTWEPLASGAGAAALARLAEQASLVVFPFAGPAQPNFAVTRLSPRERLASLSAEQVFEVEVRSYGVASPTRRSLRLLVDGQLVAEQSLAVAGSGAHAATFTYRFPAPGEHLVAVELEEDSQPLDNSRWLSLPLRKAVRVLCLEGRKGEARELALAIEPRLPGRRAIETLVAGETALLEEDLSQFDALFLCNVPRFSSNEAGVLADFVASGGGLVVFLGDQVDAENYNRVLGGQGEGRRLLPASIGPLVGAEAGFHFDPLEYRHPLVREFDGIQRNGLLLAPVWRYRKLLPHPSANVRTPLALTSGDAALLEESFGHGRVLLAATAASLASVDRTENPPVPWTALTTYRAFVPLVQSMVRQAVSDRSAARNVLVGEPLASSRPLAGVENGLELAGPLFAPPGNERPAQKVALRFAGGRAAWEFNETETSGIYRAGTESDAAAQFFAVNLNPALGEGDPAALEAAELPPAFELAASGGPEGARAVSAGVRHSYFRTCLGCVLALLLAESWVAWNLGRGAA